MVPRIHGIHRLSALVEDKAEYLLPLSEEEMDMLDDVYIDTRYPGGLGSLPSGFPSKQEGERFLEIAERVYDAVREFLTEGWQG